MEQEEGKRKTYLPTKFMLTVRILVAAYLLYVAYSLWGNLGTHSGNELIFYMAVMILFALIGAVMAAVSAVSLMKGKYSGGKTDGEAKPGQEEKEDK